MRVGQFEVSASTIYRWIERGYAGCRASSCAGSAGTRGAAAGPRPTAHGEARSFAAFMGLPDEERGSACEMGTVIGLKSDGRCLLTLYQRPCKFQLALLVPGKDSASTESEPARAGGAMPRTHPNGPGGPARRERELGKRGTGVYAPVPIAAETPFPRAIFG